MREITESIVDEVEHKVTLDPVGYEECIQGDQESVIFLAYSLLILRVVLHILGGVEVNDGEDGIEQKK